MLAFIVVAALAVAGKDQAALEPVVNAGERTLTFDWPAVRIGTGEYEEGPTGVTVFHFPEKALAAVDVRGGGPGTVNTDYLRLGYDSRQLDSVVFAGGSWYGLEATTAVATALKDDGIRDGWPRRRSEPRGLVCSLSERRAPAASRGPARFSAATLTPARAGPFAR